MHMYVYTAAVCFIVNKTVCTMYVQCVYILLYILLYICMYDIKQTLLL